MHRGTANKGRDRMVLSMPFVLDNHKYIMPRWEDKAQALADKRMQRFDEIIGYAPQKQTKDDERAAIGSLAANTDTPSGNKSVRGAASKGEVGRKKKGKRDAKDALKAHFEDDEL